MEELFVLQMCDKISLKLLWQDWNVTHWNFAQTYKLGFWGQTSPVSLYLLHAAAVYCRNRLGACPYQLFQFEFKKGNGVEIPFLQLAYGYFS